MPLNRAVFAVTLLAMTPAQAIEMDFSGSVAMGLVGTGATSSPAPYAALETRFDFSIETDGGVTIGLTVPVTTETTDQGWTIRISDQ